MKEQAVLSPKMLLGSSEKSTSQSTAITFISISKYQKVIKFTIA
jgi:hypothetical protein